MDKLLKDISLFGITQNFEIKESKRYVNKLDIILTFVFYLGVLVPIFYFFKQILNHEQVGIYSFVTYEDNQEINFLDGQHIVLFALEDKDEINFIDDSIYTIEATYYEGTYDEEVRDIIFKEKPIELVRCSETNYKTNIEYFSALDFDNLFCFKNKADLILRGGYSSKKYNYVGLQVKKCIQDNNITHNDISGVGPSLDSNSSNIFGDINNRKSIELFNKANKIYSLNLTQYPLYSPTYSSFHLSYLIL